MHKKIITVFDFSVIDLGYVGDDMSTIVRFPVASILTRFGNDGEFELLLSSPNEEQAHTITDITRNGQYIEWVVPASELEKSGNGEAQLVYTDGYGKTHSRLWSTKIKKSILRSDN